ncbi:MAG: hypothetical protein P9L99_02565 [Candidatus Lernaella stagnicola]|nr:hypothetical protein [Candidatus Lernaella stagnicola]
MRATYLPLLALLALAVLVGAACDSGEDDSGTSGSDDDDDNDSNDDDVWGDPGDLNVVEYDELGGEPPCEVWDTCVDDYFAFLDIAADFARPRSHEALENEIAANWLNGEFPPDLDTTESQTEGIIREALNIDFLREGIADRLLEVARINQRKRGDYWEEELLFSDPYVGTFHGVLWLPAGTPPYPGVVAIHGHDETSAGDFLEGYEFERYPRAGLAVLAISMRANGATQSESDVSWAMLENGFTLLTMRNYETLLALKYLKFREDVDAEAIGLIGHSGGSVGSNLTIRHERAFAAYVSDETALFSYYSTATGYVLDETIPDLAPYAYPIDNLTHTAVPTMQVPYGYGAEHERILDFWERHLR